MYSRSYMGDPEAKGPALKCVFILIIINVLFFIIIRPEDPLYYELALSSYGIKTLKIWEFVTYSFLHGNFFHILLNMWGLYLFGTLVAPELGVNRFLKLYFISALTGSLLWVIFNWGSGIPVIGASGALFGVMMAVAMIKPNEQFFLLIPPMPMKTKTMVIVYAALEIISEM